ncbi:hypothetical protein EJ04DRAFT_565424 [Polyplosphaeria fusca]|uniref:PD-(D/E)XK nuclease-like domain-containing protein n=1 Tax=Polyplosphaeria fusca TaxID=682080 RepID=A0A9P4V027_9PLEO|nr:hypothetical protein EJ04DRAFT_565424 [Polyplosphaeria fusca]
MDPIDPEAYDYEDTRSISDSSLLDVLDRVRNIFQDACHCTEFGRDENAWQSQNIRSRYLSTILEPTPASPDRRIALTRKTDFCSSYSCFGPHFAEMYTQLAAANTPIVSHTTDNCTQRLGLFSGIEVKPENGDLKEAELQITLWMAASLQKKMELGHLAFSVSDAPPALDGVADNEASSTDQDSAVV